MNPSLQVSQKAKKKTLRVFACLRVSDVCLFVCACACVCVWVYVHLCAWLVAGSLGPLGKGGTGLAPLGPIAYEAFPLLFLRFCACLLCLSVRLFIYACSCHFQCISAILGTKQKKSNIRKHTTFGNLQSSRKQRKKLCVSSRASCI